MSGRDPRQAHRPATPLELLFDLTFVVTFAIAGDQFAHSITQGHWQTSIVLMAFAVTSISWAWMNFSWFASAYDTDDWIFRITTLVQMVGVVVFALGLPAWFSSYDTDTATGNSISLSGYVILRAAMIGHWIRVAAQDAQRRRTALTYVAFVGAAQIGWIVLTVTSPSHEHFTAVAIGLLILEIIGPVLAERKGDGSPWHARHLVERHGLLAIIALGEVIFGTIAAVSALIERQGVSVDALLIVVAGVGLTFGLWWIYFLLPSGDILERYRGRTRAWSYLHILLYGAIAATGAGLHVAAYLIEGYSPIGVVGAVLSVAIPVLLFALTVYVMYLTLMRAVTTLNVRLLLGSISMLAISTGLAAGGASLGICLLVIAAAPAVSIIGYEAGGHRRHQQILTQMMK